MPRKPKKLIRLAAMTGFRLPKLEIILLTAGDNPRNVITNGSNMIDDVNAFLQNQLAMEPSQITARPNKP